MNIMKPKIYQRWFFLLISRCKRVKIGSKKENLSISVYENDKQ